MWGSFHMNKKVITIGILTLVALGGLIFYTYGPASHPIGPTVNPTSLQPTPNQNNGGSNSAVNTYHNRDLVENFYTIQFPRDWKLEPVQPGEYVFSFSQGAASVETMDVPDNSTLELFVLSQDEPKLKSSFSGYTRLNYKTLLVQGNSAYQLVYTIVKNGVSYQTTRTYISGADKSGVITLSADASQATAFAPIFDSIMNSFQWEK